MVNIYRFYCIWFRTEINKNIAQIENVYANIRETNDILQCNGTNVTQHQYRVEFFSVLLQEWPLLDYVQSQLQI